MPEIYTLSLNAEQLMERSREMTGIELLDTDAVEPLHVLVKSMNEDGGFHERGAVAWENRLLRMLCNRLRMQRDFQRHPEISEQKIVKPLFIYGMARSGTTKTQKVLAATGDFNWLPYWMTFNPSLISGDRGESTQQRITEAEENCRYFDEMSPETKLGHSFEAMEPEEDTLLTEHCLIAPFIGNAEVPSYMEWMAQQDPRIIFRFLKDSLKYLQWQGLASESKPWLLKAPTYYGLESELLDVFPDARLVMTHRTPLSTVPSAYKLCTCIRKPYTDFPGNAEMITRGFAMMLKKHIATREQLKNEVLLDIAFDEITKSIDDVVEKIYAHTQMTLSVGAQQNIAAWSESNPIHKRGKFNYSIAETGVSESFIKEEMQDYFDLIGRLSENNQGKNQPADDTP